MVGHGDACDMVAGAGPLGHRSGIDPDTGCIREDVLEAGRDSHARGAPRRVASSIPLWIDSTRAKTTLRSCGAVLEEPSVIGALAMASVLRGSVARALPHALMLLAAVLVSGCASTRDHRGAYLDVIRADQRPPVVGPRAAAGSVVGP